MREAAGAACLAAALLTGCTTPPPAGSTREQVLSAWGAPTARYALPQGGERLEYASGPYGRTTWMLDLDASGRLVQARQVLGEAEFARLQQAGELTPEELLRWIGTPGERRGIAHPPGQVWSWRYPTNDCLQFEATVGADGKVHGTGYGIDRRCDAPGNRD